MDGEETLIDYQQHPEKPLKGNLPGLKKKSEPSDAFIIFRFLILFSL